MEKKNNISIVNDDDYDKIVIIVGGRAGIGKSTIISIIKDALKKNGLNVEFNGGSDFETEEEFDRCLKPYLDKRISAIDKTILIKEIQFARKLWQNIK